MILQNRRGQVVVEYILLLVVAVTIAAVIVKGLADRSEGNQGIIVKRWIEIQKEIGGDLPDRCSGNECSTQ